MNKEFTQKGFDLAPIPLTAEMLEKNHFIRLEDGSDEPWYVYNDILVGLWCDGARLIVFYTDNMNFYGGSAAVHELQRAFRIFGLNELADNFKID